MRLLGFKGDVFKDIAHVMVGLFLGAGFYGRDWYWIGLGAFISLVEIFVFATGFTLAGR